ncbi:transcription initiation protein [Phycicoccus sp. MAQZ13P-2]|uniref:YciI family protein n=1 Tax=Phycicoccus mangrovi TaxID=2840470 RepID=UPI001C0003F7|nr:YciI family protein [Phycicoccus mangrovi]MBT9256706.1 transcription initiation protein [Phycicoccus mangrovi]MBT9274730.1 transcription initiation protein [Phycicoccus mangrovi]
MSRHLVLLPAPEAEWAQLPPEEHEKGMRSHQRFHADLAAGGHRIVVAGPLTPSDEAISMRPDGSGGALVTDGPFTESVEQMVGFYLVDTDDRDDLVRVCREFAARGELIEFRDMVPGTGQQDDGPVPS